MKHILYIENETANYNLIERYLHGLNVQLTRGHDGRHGLQLVKSQVFDLIFVDVLLPDITIDSFPDELFYPLRQASNAPIYILTAYASDDQRKQLEALGCDRYFAKPISMVEFREVIQSQLGL